MLTAMHAGATLDFHTRDIGEQSRESSRPARQERASNSQISELPMVCFSEGVLGVEDDTTCAVCLCEYAVGDVLRRLPCGHHFHRCCTDTWLKRSKQCPLCRGPIDSRECPA